MPQVALTFKVTPAVIDSLTVDATIEEVHTAEVDTTENPVEQGVDVTDHARPKPRPLQMEGIVSDTPLPSPAGGAVPGRSLSAYKQLLDLWASPRLITITTGLETYSNMVMKSLVVTRNASSGRAVRFRAMFQEVQLVQNQTVQIARKGKALPSKNLSKQAATPAEPPKSWLLQAGQGLGAGGVFQ